MVIENEQELASDVESAVQTTVDILIGNAAMLVVDGEESNVDLAGSVAGHRRLACDLGGGGQQAHDTEHDRIFTCHRCSVCGINQPRISPPALVSV